jgi:hypothetical protein
METKAAIISSIEAGTYDKVFDRACSRRDAPN